ncbi:hypothetical protein E4U17_003451 [Claviceps sp. LM77 group G4]|nr:hypothetical protein E4U17_003451 [Claviceps sp. LM77 group G4]
MYCYISTAAQKPSCSGNRTSSSFILTIILSPETVSITAELLLLKIRLTFRLPLEPSSGDPLLKVLII